MSGITQEVARRLEILEGETDPTVFAPILMEFKNNEEVLAQLTYRLGAASFPYLEDLTDYGGTWGFATRERPDLCDKVPLRLRERKQFLKEAIYTNGLIYRIVPEHLRDDFEIGLSYLAYLEEQYFDPLEPHDGWTFELPAALCANRNFLRQAVVVFSAISYYLPDELKNDAGFVYELFQLAPDMYFALSSPEGVGYHDRPKDEVEEELRLRAEVQRLAQETPTTNGRPEGTFKV